MKPDTRPHPTVKHLLAALLVAFFPLATQAAEPAAPNAGSILQEIKPMAPQPPSSVGTGLTIERAGSAKMPPSAPFLVKTIRITGNENIDSVTLHALVADGEGKSLNLIQLGKLVARITDYYRSHGYPLARAVIPAQTIQDGVLVIEIIEARYGIIRLGNDSRVNTPLLEKTLSPLQSGQAIGQAEMDSALLLLSDIPGITVNATLKPGEAVGTSDLAVNAAAGPALAGNVTLDNYGNQYTGRVRLGGTVNFVNPLRHGDVLSMSGLSSGEELNYGRVAYEWLLSGKGTRLGASYSSLRYVLGGSLSNLNSQGTAEVGSLWAKHPMVRQQDINLYGKIQYDQMALRDHIDLTDLRTDRSLRTWTLSLAGDERDALLAGGVTTWNATLTSGHVRMNDVAAQLADAATARTEGGFSKWNLSFARLQALNPENTVYLAFSGQWANDNLDSSQKIIAGGPYTVRAYDMGSISGDSGYLGTAEFRRNLGSAWKGQWQAVAFVDSAHITVNQTTWITGENSATLSGVGVGLNWAESNQWNARAYVATRLGSTPALVARTSATRGWIEIGRSF